MVKTTENLKKEVLMMRPMAVVLLQLGLVLLALAVLARLLPIPNQADVIADDLAIIASGVLVAMALVYLRLTKGDQ